MNARAAVASCAFTFALLASAGVARAAGVNLSWDDCGAAGVTYKCFACDANDGRIRLVASFAMPIPSDMISGVQFVLDLQTDSSDLPDWWKFRAAGTCRQQSLSASLAFADSGLTTCGTFLPANVTGGITNYIAPFSTPDRARLLLAYSLPIGTVATVEADREYYGVQLYLDLARSAGPDACAGCLVPTVLVLNAVKVSQANGLGDFLIQNPLVRNDVSWQPASPYPCTSVPVRGSTWGSIKAQYR